MHSADCLLTNVCAPAANGLFSAAISMSGAANVTFTLVRDEYKTHHSISLRSHLHLHMINQEQAETYMLEKYVPVSPCAHAPDNGTLLAACLLSADAHALMTAYDDSAWNPAWMFGIPFPSASLSNHTRTPLRGNVAINMVI